MTAAAAAAVFVVAVGIHPALAQIKGTTKPPDPNVALIQRIAALNLRVKQLQLGQAAIEQSLQKADVAADAPG